ncbi:hypothetical protein M441DRAFT_42839 [Trichoderma asperellum CBS 433.97]|uniref:Uncharacterized protein n=1 Tax=Trichoderma asperellum (strain ATCC 204424 / CBS 433.97 / NBRC 101777) TaxID=1042311 RepID=A0A2T3ZQQ1_TRIA4|nr:hypothetical protein M441DRAFT_42839 [Trichoderma asperellum CBS 433.97]PTB47126.1 hypothetical protein M441DRAFT_42839 [Trichoderma asperellum CBS 433.97]
MAATHMRDSTIISWRTMLHLLTYLPPDWHLYEGQLELTASWVLGACNLGSKKDMVIGSCDMRPADALQLVRDVSRCRANTRCEYRYSKYSAAFDANSMGGRQAAIELELQLELRRSKGGSEEENYPKMLRRESWAADPIQARAADPDASTQLRRLFR